MAKAQKGQEVHDTGYKAAYSRKKDWQHKSA